MGQQNYSQICEAKF